MKYEPFQNLSLPKIGFGTWTIGGESHPNHSLEEKSLHALRSALEMGYTHFDTAEYYAGGHAEELLGQSIRASGRMREDLFITSKVSPEHLSYEKVLHSCESSRRRLGLEYLDLYLIHWPSRFIKLPETIRALNRLVAGGKIRHLGVSNFNLKLLKEAVELCETKLMTDQVSYSLADLTCVRYGVLAYCQQNGILLTAYSPVKPRYIRGNNPLRMLAERRGITPQQMALAWLVQQPAVITIPMSFDPQHQAENLAAADLELSESELVELAAARGIDVL